MTRKREIMRVERTKEEEMMRRALRFVLPQATQNAQRKLSQRETSQEKNRQDPPQAARVFRSRDLFTRRMIIIAPLLDKKKIEK